MPSRPSGARAVDDAHFLDTNVVMYAIGASHPLREPCRAALRHAVSANVRLITDAEVLQEILHRYFSLRRPDVARTAYHATVTLCHEILPVTEPDTARALALLQQYSSLSARDALHVATMEAKGVRRLLSTDSDFDAVASVERIDPTEFLG